MTRHLLHATSLKGICGHRGHGERFFLRVGVLIDADDRVAAARDRFQLFRRRWRRPSAAGNPRATRRPCRRAFQLPGTTPTRASPDRRSTIPTYHEPPAGSTTCVRWHSFWRMSCVLRARRWLKSSGGRRTSSNAPTCRLSQPPSAPANASTVARSRLLCGSQTVLFHCEVRTCRESFRAASLPSSAPTSLRPEQAQRAQLGDLLEERRTDRDRKAHPRGGGVHIHAAIIHFAEILQPGGERESEFLDRAAAGFVPGATVHANGLEMRRVGRRPARQHRHFAIGIFDGLRQFAFVGDDAERVHLDAAAQIGGEDSCAFARAP